MKALITKAQHSARSAFGSLRANRIVLLLIFVSGLREAFATTNASESIAGTHVRSFTKLADAAHTYRHLLVKPGSDADHVAVGDASTLPIGLCPDSPSAAEDPVEVLFLGAQDRTVLMTCTTAIATETDVYAAANGYVTALPAAAGTYYKVGRTKEIAKISGTANIYTVEVEPHQPVAVVVGGAIGYSAGAGIGGTVTQLTDRSTGVTLNALTGQITTNNASLGAGAEASFTVTNSQVAAKDVIALSITPGGTGTPQAYVSTVAAGSFQITVTNLHGSTADTSADVINFAVIKGQTT